MAGIWLPDDVYNATAGQIWSQGQHATLQAGQDWAKQAMQQAIQPAQDAISKLQSMVPAVPTPVATPAPPPPVPVTPPPEAPAPTPMPTAPAPVTPPLGVGQTPTSEPTPGTPAAPAPAPMPTPAPQPTPAIASALTPAPTPSPVADLASAGQNWAQQQITNLLNPAQPPPQTSQAPSTPPSAPQAMPSLDTSTGLPSAVSGPSPTPTPTPAPTQTATTPGGPIDSSSPQAFAQSIAPYAQAAAQKLGIDPKWVAAMAGSESNYGKAAGNELFGIKALPGQPGTSMQTHEGEYGGTTQNATFASYDTPQAAVDAFTNLIQNHYPGAVGAQSLGDFVHGLKQGGYFTAAEPEYKGILQGISDRIGGTVDSALGGAQQAVSTGVTAVNTAAQGAQSAIAARTSQFGLGLSSGDAMAFCGPAAAMAFAQTYGRNPTVDEAKQLATQVGWNPNQGMAGVSSEVSLLKNMGIDAHATQGVDWGTVGQDAAGGNPVIIDTPGHYYYVDGFNQDTGKLHVGTSGTDLKGGSEWMSPDQINAMPQSGGNARAAIFADHPLSGPGQAANLASSQTPSPSTSQFTMGANQPTGPDLLSLLNQVGQQAPNFGAGALLQTGQNLATSLLGGSPAIQNQGQAVKQAVLDVGGGGVANVLGSTQNLLGNVPGSAQDLLNSVQNTVGVGANAGAQLPSYLQGLAQTPQVQSVQDLLGNALGVGAGAGGSLNDWLNQQRALGQQYGVDIGPRLDLSQPLGPQLGVDPYGQIVQQGIPNMIQGVQQGNVGDVLGGGFQTLMGAASVLPGTGGLGSEVAAPALGKALELADVLRPPEIAYASTRGAGESAADYAARIAQQEGTAAAAAPATGAEAAEIPAGRFVLGGIPLGDWIKGAYKGGVISSLHTAADVAVNSTLTPALTQGGAFLRDIGTGNFGAARGRAIGLQSGVAEWGNNWMKGLSDISQQATSLPGRADPGLATGVANAITGPAALHNAFQTAGGGLIDAMEKGAAAGDAASSAGGNWLNAFHDALANPSQDVVDAARFAAQRATGRGELGRVATALGNAITQAGPIGDALFPVYKMGMSFGARMIDATPLGLAGTVADVGKAAVGMGPYAKGFSPTSGAVAPLEQRLTDNLIGTVASVWLANQAVGGAITGDGPTDPGQRATWIANGNQPNSVRLPNGQYYSWENAPPQLKGPLMMAGAYADSVDAYNRALAKQGTAGANAYNVEDPRQAQAMSLVAEVGRQVLGATPLKTLAGLYDALTSGQNLQAQGLSSLTGMASDVAGGAVPYSGLVRSVAEMTDPVARQVLQARQPGQIGQNIQENVAQNIPVFRQGLPVAQDILGRPRANPMFGAGELLPWRQAAGQQSPVLGAMEDVGVAPSLPPSTIPLGRGQEIALTPEQQRTWQQLYGGLLQQAVGPLVNSPGWQTGPNVPPQIQKGQQIALQRVDAQLSQAATKMMLGVVQQKAQQEGKPLESYAQPTPGGVLAPTVGYGPDVQLQQALLYQQLQERAQHQALIAGLLGGMQQPSPQPVA